jgi:hypothetical protein
MSDKDIRVTSLKDRDVDLKITLQGTTLKIELPLSPTGRPSEMPFAAVDQQRKEEYLTKAENRLTDYLVGKAGIGGFNVDKVTGSAKGEGDISAVKLEFSSTAEANRVFADKGFINSLQRNFDQDRKQEHMDAAAAWTQGIGGGGARIPYNGVVLKVDDKTAFQYYTRNFDEKTCPAEKQGEHFMLKMLMDSRYGIGAHKKLSAADGVESPSQEPGEKTLVASASAAAPAQNNDGNRSQIERQNPQAAANMPSSPTLVEGNETVNRLFKQAILGVENTNVPNKLDAAALAVQTISQAQGFKQDQDISIVQGNKGLIVSQGEGAAAMNLLVPQANRGDYEKVSAQMSQSQPQPNIQLAHGHDQDLTKQQSARVM